MSCQTIDNKWIYKIVIFGETNVGKTTLTKKFVKNEYYDNIKKTIGVDFEIKTIHIPNDVSITLQLWDFSGEKHFEVLFPYYLGGTDGAIFLYDISKFQSLQELDRWLKIIYYSFANINSCLEKIYKQDNIEIPILIVASKCDLLEDQNQTIENKNNFQVLIDLGKETAKLRNFDFYQVSSKTGKNVEKIFVEIAMKIKEIKKNQEQLELKKKKILSKLFQ